MTDTASGSGGNGEGDGTVLVSCESCNARYKVPEAQLSRPGLKLKCTNCGHMFVAPDTQAPAPLPPQEALVPEIQAPGDAAGKQAAQGSEMPVPDEARVSSMFDDLQVNAGVAATGGAETGGREDPTSLESPSKSGSVGSESDQAYLEAVSFAEDGAVRPPPSSGSIPDSQKHNFFLKPPSLEERVTPEGTEAGLPPLGGEEEQFTGVTPDEDQEVTPPMAPPFDGPEEPVMNASGNFADLPPLDEDPAEQAEPSEPDPNLPALAPEGEPRDTEPVPEQHEYHPHKENRTFWLLIAAVLLVMLISAGWGAALINQPGAASGFDVKSGAPAELSVTPTRGGYFITNKPSGEKLYVLTGEVMNRFGDADQVGWIRLKGVTYANGQSIQEGHSYMGNLLNDSQLATWALPAIKAYHGYNNGRNDVNFQIPQNKTVPYQIVLRRVRQPIERTEAKIISYLRRGKPVYLQHIQ
ncbi:MAG: zinc-ribbon domain-containing protein [SAR324 cluster bacterium]|nr:zinc-ribbon domain-containing protein [SAR324 cluster bacterium]MCZ6645046.1 zinc-ribbon domain-containing protein [SAR324 cluster bacterium]